MGSYGDIQWADDAMHRHYLVSWGGDDIDMGDGLSRPQMGFASLGEIVDKIAHEAWHVEDGEEADQVKAWRLTEHGPRVVTFGYSYDHGMVAVCATWSEGLVGRRTSESETGFYHVRG